MKNFNSFSFAGLNTFSEPTDLEINEFSECSNIWIDRSGQVLTRPGTVKKENGNFHSLYGFEEFGICVADGALTFVNTDTNDDLELTFLRWQDFPDEPVSYCKLDRYVYWINRHENGKINIDTVESEKWEYDPDTYVGPKTNNIYFGPPTGELITFFKGIMWIANDYELWHSNPFSVSMWRKSKNWILMEEKINLLNSTYETLWVGTTDGIYSFSGTSPDDFVLRKVLPYTAIKGTSIKLIGSQIKIPEKQGLDFSSLGEVLLVKTSYGDYLLSDQVVHPIQKVRYTGHSRGMSCLFDDTVITTIRR